MLKKYNIKNLSIIAALFILEFLAFDFYGSHRFTKIYPRWNDQIQYLTEAYTSYTTIHSDGVLHALSKSLIEPASQGVLLRTMSVFLFLIVEPSRSAALSFNIIGIIIWQLFLYVAVLRFSKSTALSLASLALPLVIDGSWIDQPGSAYDFRLDHITMCAIGVTLSSVLISQGFRSLKWSCFVGLFVGMTMILRFITSTYFFVILFFTIIWIMFGDDRKNKLWNLACCFFITLIIILPIFYIHRVEMWNYYYYGHYTGPEAFIRNQNFSLLKSFYIIILLLQFDHLGVFFWFIALFGSIGYILINKRNIKVKQIDYTFFYFGLLFLLAPAFVLSIHPQLSSVVISALCPGVVVVIIAIWTLFYTDDNKKIFLNNLFCYIILTISCSFYLQRQTRVSVDEYKNKEYRKVVECTDLIEANSKLHHIDNARIAVNFISDAFDAQIMRVMVYEHNHKWLSFIMTLPTGIFEPSKQQILTQLSISDFVYFTDTPIVNGYPFDKKLFEMRNEVKLWCDKNMFVIKDFNYFGKHIVLYERNFF